MLSFKTQFPIRKDASIQAVVESFRAWIVGSPHSHLQSMLASHDALDDEQTHSLGGEKISFARHKVDGHELCGVRYENVDVETVRWLTEIVGSRTPSDFWISVQLSADTELPVERMEAGKKPYVIKTILERIGGGQDGVLEVSGAAHNLSVGQLELAADLICARAGCVLPIVYVSRRDDGSISVDANMLASWLAGMAHIVVEPTRRFSFELMREVYGENAYGGAVALYFPDGIGKHIFLATGKLSAPLEMQIAIQRKIRASLLSQRTRRDCAWGFIQEVKARTRIAELKSLGSHELDKYVAAFDQDSASKNEEIQRLEHEVLRLRYGAMSNAHRIRQGQGELALDGKEHDIYQGERLQIVLDALEKELKTSEQFSRRQTVVRDLIESNQRGSEQEQLVSDIKQALTGYVSMTAPVRAELTRLGFTILDDGKHYKLIFRGDNRFPHVLAKTPSDQRGVLNAISDMKKKLF